MGPSLNASKSSSIFSSAGKEDSRLAFHWLMITLGSLIHVGAIIDAWTHIHFGFAIESFLSPSHYVLYAMWFSTAIALTIYAVRSALRGEVRSRWLPRGYNISAIGVVLYGLGGVFDAFWHEAFGFEVFFEAAVAPSHIWLVFSAFLIYLGTVRHSLYRRDLSPEKHSSSFITALPLSLGLALLLATAMWITWYFDPLIIDYASGGAVAGHFPPIKILDFSSPTAQIAGYAGIVLTNMILVGFVLVPLYRWRLPVGTVTVMVVFHYLTRAFTNDGYVYLPAVIGAGMAAEITWAWIRSGGEQRMSSASGYRLIAFLVPSVLSVAYFSIIATFPAGIVWPVHIWGGAIAISVLGGVLLSYGVIDDSKRNLTS